ncbi:MAG TPA: TetR/AcrR family transcriptional regulator [Hydrogenophaga sp.]|nr:TetR/AcrR family transcriptional regulator [Hydrogenophaga sp.]
MSAAVKPRRKPIQSRAWMTSNAIQDAFVLLLIERGYEKVTMRAIATVAGVGLGTLYEYFPGKASIAAVTVRRWMRKQAALLAEAVSAAQGSPLVFTLRSLVQAHVGGLLSQATEWRALMYLERHISSPSSYREIYREFVSLFREAMTAASDWPPALDAQRHANHIFSIVDAITHQVLLIQTHGPDAAEVAADIENAVLGYWQMARTMRIEP